MALMGLKAVYPLKSLSKGGWIKYRMPYLLRGMRTTRRNQVWSTDISYIPMKNGFLYLYAIINVYSRYIVGWSLYNTLDASNAIEVLERAVAAHSTHYGNHKFRPGSAVHYTCEEWHGACDRYGIRISMDGRARCLDNVWIERFWRTIKREYVYLNPDRPLALYVAESPGTWTTTTIVAAIRACHIGRPEPFTSLPRPKLKNNELCLELK